MLLCSERGRRGLPPGETGTGVDLETRRLAPPRRGKVSLARDAKKDVQGVQEQQQTRDERGIPE